MYTMNATVEQDGITFEMRVGNFKSFSEVAIFLMKYSETHKFTSCHIEKIDA